MSRREKPYDIAISPAVRRVIYKRRLEPDGRRLPVAEIRVGEHRHKFPWRQMADGDYFVVPITGSERAMLVAFYQAAQRLDIEISIARVDEGFRVTRVLEGIRKIKTKALALGAKVQVHDPVKYAERQRGRHGGRGDPAPATDIATQPVDAPRAPSPPTGDPVPTYDRRAMLAAAREQAKKELNHE